MASHLIIVGGYLGAGKTTLLRALRRKLEGVDALTVGYPIVDYIINDFASYNADEAALLHEINPATIDSAKHVHSVSGGCICCSKLPEFLQIVATIAHRNQVARIAGLILVETTGLADIWPLIDATTQKCGNGLVELRNVVVVLDAPSVLRLETNHATPPAWPLRLEQVRAATTIVVSKSDLIKSEALSTEHLLRERVHAALSDLNVHVAIASNGQIDADVLLADCSREVKERMPLAADYVARSSSEETEAEKYGFSALVLSSNTPILSLEATLACVEALLSGISRSKGYFADATGTWWSWSSVGRQLDIGEVAFERFEDASSFLSTIDVKSVNAMSLDGENESASLRFILVALGTSLQREAISEEWRKLLA